MREHYHEQLRGLIEDTARLTRLVEHALSSASTALLEADTTVAGQALAGTHTAEVRCAELDDRAIQLLAREQPVATDLRTIVAVLRMSADLSRMAVLTRHLTQMVTARLPGQVVPSGARTVLAELAAATQQLVGHVADLVSTGGTEAECKLVAADDEIDRLQVLLYATLIKQGPTTDIEGVLDATLIGRYYERIADHAVSLAHCLLFRAGQVALD